MTITKSLMIVMTLGILSSCAQHQLTDRESKPQHKPELTYVFLRFQGQKKNYAGMLVPVESEDQVLSLDTVFSTGHYCCGVSAIRRHVKDVRQVKLAGALKRLTSRARKAELFEDVDLSADKLFAIRDQCYTPTTISGLKSGVILGLFRGQDKTTAGLVFPELNWAPDIDYQLKHAFFFRSLTDCRKHLNSSKSSWIDGPFMPILAGLKDEQIKFLFANASRDD